MKVPEPEAERFAIDAPGHEVWAYHAAWMGESWRVYDLGAFRRLLFFDLVAGKDGRIENRNGWPEQWEDLRRRAREARVPLDPVISVLGKEAFSAIFASRDARSRLLDEILASARASSGVHLDVEVFEPVSPEATRGFRSFLVDLRGALDAPPRKVLSAFVPVNAGLYGRDELALLDAVVAQGYDLHWRESPRAGPVAALRGDRAPAWEAAANALVRDGVSPRRILFSTPFYGYEWPTVSGEPGAASRAPGSIITYAPVPAALLPDLRVSALERASVHGLRRDAATRSPWYAFQDSDGWRQGWFDDALSLAPRLDFVRAGNFRGVAVFVLGYDGGALLDVIQSSFRGRSATTPGGAPRAGP